MGLEEFMSNVSFYKGRCGWFFSRGGDIDDDIISRLLCHFLLGLYVNFECTMNKCSLPEIGPVPVEN